jgi:hypothetical protein
MVLSPEPRLRAANRGCPTAAISGGASGGAKVSYRSSAPLPSTVPSGSMPWRQEPGVNRFREERSASSCRLNGSSQASEMEKLKLSPGSFPPAPARLGGRGLKFRSGGMRLASAPYGPCPAGEKCYDARPDPCALLQRPRCDLCRSPTRSSRCSAPTRTQRCGLW